MYSHHMPACLPTCLPACLSFSPFHDDTAARPRLRPLPPAPQWLKNLLGPDADTAASCDTDQEGTYSSLE